jgi:AAA+ superfamily predicted ATPase
MSDMGDRLRNLFGISPEQARTTGIVPGPLADGFTSLPSGAGVEHPAEREPAGDSRQPPRHGHDELPALPPEEPYASSAEHLHDELRRIDYLVRARLEIWQDILAAHKPPEQLALPIITAREIDAYLAQPYHELRPPRTRSAQRRVRLMREASHALGHAIARRRALTPPDVSLRVAELVRRCGLTDLERDVVLICLLPEIDARYRRLFGYLLDDGSRSQPTVELAQSILSVVATETGRALFAPASALARRRLIVLGEESRGDDALSARSVRLDDRISGYLLDDDSLAAPLVGLLAPAASAGEQIVLDAETRARLRSLAAWWSARRAHGEGAVLSLHGPYGSGRRTAARLLCEAANTPLLVIDTGAVPRGADWRLIVDLCYREAALTGAALCWAGCDGLLADEERASDRDALLAAAEAHRGLTVLTAATAWDPAGKFRDVPFVPIPLPAPDFAARRDLWRAILPGAVAFAEGEGDRDALAETLANGFQLTPGQMHDALATARWHAVQRDPSDPRLRGEDLAEGCRRQSGRRLIAFSTRIEARSGLDFADLILPEANLRQLRELRDRLAHQGRVRGWFERRLSLGQGLIALFTGGSGTGKTMAAELLARDQGLDLYKIDLSAVVSKWVGETEKNLSRVFAEAADANAILFFDEADAIFGKRAKVEHGQDRWANMEVNFLLQRVEEYAGVVIMASNLRQNIDDAFMRRIQIIVDFPFPEAGARFEIIRGLIPSGVAAPPDVDLDAMAQRFKLPGGSWKNIVVDAAYRAAASANGHRPTLTTRHLVLATAREYQKLGKPLNRGEFGEEFFAWVQEEML